MAKSNSTKGAKKGRRFNRPRSQKAKDLCAQRKAARRKVQDERERLNNEVREYPLWIVAKRKRYAKRHP